MGTNESTRKSTREEWLAERRTGIGGSDAAAVLGLSPWATPVTVWLEKTGRAAPKPETEAMRIGTELEDFVARRYMDETGRRVTRFTRMIHDGCLLGNFDRLVVPAGAKVASHMGEVRTDTLLECKTASSEWDGDVPLYYQTQVQHYMGLAPSLVRADVAVLFLGRKHFEIFRVERDQTVIEHIRETLTDWWKSYVVADRCPPPSNEDDCRLLWARSNPGKTVTATDAVRAKLREYALEKTAADEAKARMEAARNAVLAAMGEAETLAAPDGRPLATWKSARDTERTDWEAVARALGTPEQVAYFAAKNARTVPGTRRFLLKPDALGED